MKITAIDELPGLKALTEADAIADGFDSLAALRAEIQKIYGNASQIGTRTLYRIKFEWPIDDAGKKLVINPPSPSQAVKPAEDSEIRNKKKTAVPARNKSAMTARQRELLRAFVVSKHPRSSPI
jgi:hypothetical protein